MQKLTFAKVEDQDDVVFAGAGAVVSKRARITHESKLVLRNVQRIYTAQGATARQVLATAADQAQIERSNPLREIPLADFAALHGLTMAEVTAALKTDAKTIDFANREFVDRVSLVAAGARPEPVKTVDEMSQLIQRQVAMLEASGRKDEAAAYRKQYPGAFAS